MLVNTCPMRPALVPRGDAVSRCWSTTTAETHRSTARPGAQLVCCIGLRKEREGVPGAQLVCCTGLRKEREGAPPAVGLQVRTLILHATSTRIPDTVLCSAVGNCTLGESKGSGPLGGRTQGMDSARSPGCPSLREGTCCEERSRLWQSACPMR